MTWQPPWQPTGQSAGQPTGQSAGPPRQRGSLALHVGRCTSCMVCARECPVWCIAIASHAATAAAAGDQRAGSGAGGGRRTRSEHVLDRFDIDFGLCMYCGICVDACPFDALAWTPYPVPQADAAARLVLGKDELAAAWAGVPEPEPLDPRAATPDRTPRGARGRR